MGLDLSLLPFDCDLDTIHYSHTILDCERRYALFDPLQALADALGRPVPADFRSFRGEGSCCDCGEPHYGPTTTTPYGTTLYAVTVDALLSFTQNPGVQESTKNRAIWAYLAVLPAETKVALYWH
jgi:hypothetical protein